MENRDILRQICERLDDETLFQLWKVDAYKQAISSFLTGNLFWYVRSEYLLSEIENRFVNSLTKRPDADWKKIYYALLLSLMPISNKLVHVSGMDNLDSVLVLEEVYGPVPTYTWEEQMYVWKHIESVPVIRYLVRERGLHLDTSGLVVNLLRVVKLGHLEEVLEILALL